ncbi:CinA family protein [Chryseobacterium gregarium]|uniref:CinA family protein n=1 Tax=Chryseobacterium gregarium TaxID=456299 RepID=UPI00041D00D1|nr:CinA family protein [Chryseobacterium gregarium]
MQFNKALLEEISENFMGCHETISIAESVTAGMLQLAFSEMSNSKLFYKGGITVHTPDRIVKLLKVDAAEISSHGLSGIITDTMGCHASKTFDSEWCIATSGYCMPERQSAYGIYAYYSISYKGTTVFSDKLDFDGKKDSLLVKSYYTEQILQKFLGQLKLYHILKTEIAGED